MEMVQKPSIWAILRLRTSILQFFIPRTMQQYTKPAPEGKEDKPTIMPGIGKCISDACSPYHATVRTVGSEYAFALNSNPSGPGSSNPVDRNAIFINR